MHIYTGIKVVGRDNKILAYVHGLGDDDGSLAITPLVGYSGQKLKGKYNVTHIDTGLRVNFPSMSYAQATKAVKYLSLVFPWDKVKTIEQWEQLPLPHRKALGRYSQSILERYIND